MKSVPGTSLCENTRTAYNGADEDKRIGTPATCFSVGQRAEENTIAQVQLQKLSFFFEVAR